MIIIIKMGNACCKSKRKGTSLHVFLPSLEFCYELETQPEENHCESSQFAIQIPRMVTMAIRKQQLEFLPRLSFKRTCLRDDLDKNL